MYPLPPPTPPLGTSAPLPLQPKPRSKPAFTGPLLPNGEPIPGGDPTAAWEAQRAKWLARRRPEGAPAPTKDPVFTERLTKLEDLLSGKKSVGNGAIGSKNGQGEEVDEEDDEPDGGFAVNKGPKGGQNEGELRRVGEGILLAFKQGRAVKDPIPLSLVTKLLYRSWLTDGTIPPDYVPPPPVDIFTPPSPAASASTTTSAGGAALAPPTDVPPLPAPMSFAASLYSSAVPPASFGDRATPSPIPADLPGSEGPMAPPEVGVGGGASRPAAKIDLGEEGKIRVGAISGSSWRTEKDVASGSDLY